METNGGGDGDAPVSSTVFVGNLPWSATEDELREFFAECGEIVSVRIGEERAARWGRRAGGSGPERRALVYCATGTCFAAKAAASVT